MLGYGVQTVPAEDGDSLQVSNQGDVLSTRPPAPRNPGQGRIDHFNVGGYKSGCSETCVLWAQLPAWIH